MLDLLSSLDYTSIFSGAGGAAALLSVFVPYILKLVQKDLESKFADAIKKHTEPLNTQLKKNDAATMVCLRYILKDILSEYIQQKEPITAADLDFINKLYCCYTDLGGNGVIKKMYSSVVEKALK